MRLATRARVVVALSVGALLIVGLAVGTNLIPSKRGHQD